MLLEIYLALFLAVSSGMPFAERLRPPSIAEAAWASGRGPIPDRSGPRSRASANALNGSVVNSVTNEPIANALVTLELDGQRFTLTGADGTFQFEDLPRTGHGGLMAKKPGYFSPQEVRTSQYSMSVSTRPVAVGPDQSPVVLKLIPEGVIAGRITGEGGEPIESFPVHLLVQCVENGQWVRQELHGVDTNEEGEFRVAELAGGKYFLFVGPGEGEAVSAKAHQQGMQGYPAIFYSGASDFASATPIDITPGKHAEINISLSVQPFFRVSGIVSGYPSSDRPLVQLLNSTGQSIGVTGASRSTKGSFQTEPVPPGLYTITAQTFDNETQQTFFASRPLKLDSDVSGVHLTLLPGETVPVEVRLEATHSDTSVQRGQGFTRITRGRSIFTSFGDGAPARVVLAPKDSLPRNMQYSSQRPPNADSDSLAIVNLQPGAYTAGIEPNGPYCAQSVRSGVTDLLREDLTIAPGASVQPIQIVLRDDCAGIEGKVSYDAQAESAIVIAIPDDAPGQSRQLVVSQPGGAFEIPHLTPGAYKVLAVDRLYDFAYKDPEVLRKYLSKVSEITLLPDQTANVDLELVHVGE